MKARFLFALPLAILAPLVAGCSSSSSPDTTVDSGKADTGKVTTDAGGKKDSGESTDAGGSKDSGKDTATPPGIDAGVDGGPTPAAGAVKVNKGYTTVFGKTDDDYLIFADSNGNVFAGDITGATTPILMASDSATAPAVTDIAGNYVAILENYTTKSVDGEEDFVAGDLYIWSKALGTPTKIASKASPQIFVASDSSAIAYLDGLQGTAGTYGNLGIILASALSTGAGTDVATNVVTDLMSTTCAPLAEFDGAVLVASTCANADGGGSPTVTAYAGASWTATPLALNAGVSSPYYAPYAVNYTTDTASINALTLNNATPATLSIETLTNTGNTPLTTTYGVLTNGTANYYLSTKSNFALFTETSGALGIAKLSTPADPTTAVITDLVPASGTIYGFAGVSPDENYELDYNTAPSASLGVPASLTVRSIATGTGFPLFSNAAGFSFGGANSWTADSTYVIFTDGLTAVANMTDASIGTLKSAKCADGTVNILVSDPTVWDSATLTGTDILYNVHYVAGPTLSSGTLPNGAASADLYVADASKAAPGTLVQVGADATYYVTKDKSHVFYSITAFTTGDGGALTPTAGDGAYAIAIPTP